MGKQRTHIHSDNRGLSLVELIIAISIGLIVSGSIAALITFGIRMYRNESVNTSMQYELQTNLNTMMDEIMGSQTVVVIQNSGTDIDHVNTKEDVKPPYTKCALFGKFTEGSGADAGKLKFTGVVFASSSADSDGRFKVYMDRVKDVVGADPSAVAKSCFDTIQTAFSEDPNPYLLGENVVQFVIEPDPEDTCFDDEDNTYTNPIPVKVELCFERNGWGDKKYSKHVDDVAYLRNRVSDIHNGTDTVPSVWIGTFSAVGGGGEGEGEEGEEGAAVDDLSSAVYKT